MKKWSYAAAMMLLASSGCVFTGCIDNDEPYGIEQIRVATADLLKAKKAAVESQMEAQKIQAEIEKAKYEADVIRANNEKVLREAEAKYKEALAQAELLRAQADAAETQAKADSIKAEADKASAKAEEIRAQYERDNQEMQQTLARRAAELEADIKAWELQYQKDLYDWEQWKLKEAAGTTDYLYTFVTSAFDAYMTALSTYNEAQRNQLAAITKQNQYALDLVWEEDHWVAPEYAKKTALDEAWYTAKNGVEKAQQKLTKLQDALAAVEAIQPSGLLRLRDDYEAKYTQSLEAYTEAQVALEQKKLDEKETIDKPSQLTKAITALKDSVIDIPGWTFTKDQLKPELEVLGDFWYLGDEDLPKQIVASNLTYTMNNQGNYDQSKENYGTAIANIKRAFLDANDQAWSAARVNELKRTTPQLAKDVTKGWIMAKAIYNNGNAPSVAKEIGIPREDAVEAAVTAFNDYMPTLTAAKDAYYSTQKKYDEAAKALLQAQNNYWDQEGTSAFAKYIQAQNKQAEQIAAAENVRDEAIFQAGRTYAHTISDLNSKSAAILQAVNDTYEAYNREVAAFITANPDKADDQAAIAADPKVKAAETAYITAQTNETKHSQAYTTAQTTRDAAENKAREVCQAAIDAADAEMEKAQLAFDDAGGMANAPDRDPAVVAASKAYDEADKAYTKARVAMGDAQTEANALANDYNTAVSEQTNAVNDLLDPTYAFNLVGSNLDINVYLYNEEATAPKAEIPFLMENIADGTSNAKSFIMAASNATFGVLGTDYDNNNADVDQDLAFLIDEPFDDPVENADKILEIFNDYVLATYPNTNPWNAHIKYDMFGNYSSVVKNLYGIKIGTLCLNEGFNAAIQEFLDIPKGKLNEMTAEYKRVNDRLSAMNYDMIKAEQAAKEVLADAQSVVDEKLAEAQALYDIVEIIDEGIGSLTAEEIWNLQYNGTITDEMNVVCTDAVNKIIASLENQIKAAEEDVHNATALFDEAVYMLEQYNNGYVVANPYDLEVKYWDNQVAEAEEELNQAKSRYEDIQAKYDAYVKQ